MNRAPGLAVRLYYNLSTTGIHSDRRERNRCCGAVVLISFVVEAGGAVGRMLVLISVVLLRLLRDGQDGRLVIVNCC